MELIATKRTELGKKSKRIGKEGKLPAVVFGKGEPSTPLSLNYIQFEKVFREAGESTLIDLIIEGEKGVKVLVSEVTHNPLSGKVNHANLHIVNLKEKITASVPIKVVGESPAVKSGEGLLLTLIDEVSVEALPTDLPHDIKVDISHLEQLDQGLSIKDLPIDFSKVEILGHHPDDLVVKITYAEMKEEVEEVPVTESELVAKVEATEQLTEEEKAKRAAEEKNKKEEEEK